MKNFKMVVSYDGSRYFGWEHQPDTEMTIQGKLESVLIQMQGLPEGQSVTVIGASFNANFVARMELHPWAMLANGPPWIMAGLPSKV